MPIVPDDKNWTWVLERTCPECGFSAATFDRTQAPGVLRENAAQWGELLAHPAARDRPSDDTWSALEYGCHVRDVFRLFLLRLELMLNEDDPMFANWDQDATAIEDHYAEQDPQVVASEINVAAEKLAGAFSAVKDSELGRKGFRSDGAAFTIDSFIRYLVHDPIHHVWDVERAYGSWPT